MVKLTERWWGEHGKWSGNPVSKVCVFHFRTMVRFFKVLKIYWYVFNISWISCMFLYVFALLNSYYLLFVYSHELCHVRLAKAILLQRRLKALALLQWARRCLWLSNRPQTCPKNVPKMSLPHISATSVSARARERVLVLGNSTIGDGHEDHEDPVCCRHDLFSTWWTCLHVAHWSVISCPRPGHQQPCLPPGTPSAPANSWFCVSYEITNVQRQLWTTEKTRFFLSTACSPCTLTHKKASDPTVWR